MILFHRILLSSRIKQIINQYINNIGNPNATKSLLDKALKKHITAIATVNKIDLLYILPFGEKTSSQKITKSIIIKIDEKCVALDTCKTING